MQNKILKYHRTIISRTANISQNEDGKNVIKIRFPFNTTDLMHVRTLMGRKYHKEQRCWSASISAENVKMLNEWGFKIDPRLESIISSQKINKIKMDEISPAIVPNLKGMLKHFQSIGVTLIDYLIQLNNHGALLADDMGLGKTIECTAWLQLHPEIRPALIVCPATVKMNWERELIKWMFPIPKTQILYSQSPYPITGDIIIINYNILLYWIQELKEKHFKVIILDECQNISNNTAQQTKAAKILSKTIPYRIPTSGTPMEVRPRQIYNAWKLVDPENCPPFLEFGMRYCAGYNDGWGWNFNGSSNTRELHDLLINTAMIRRRKRDVLTELPDKTYSFVPLEIDNKADYKLAEDNFIEFVRKEAGAQFDNESKFMEEKIKGELNEFMEKYNISEIDFGQHSLSFIEAKKSYQETKVHKASIAETLSQINSLKQLAAKGKIKQVILWIDDFLESDEKLVVFAHHKFIINILIKHFGKIAVKIDGSIPTPKRQAIIDKFQNDPKIKLCIISQAGGIGINLTAAHNLAVVEFPWTVGKLDQIIDREHRIGQLYGVMIYYLMAMSTIDERIAKLLDDERLVLDAVLDGKETESGNLLWKLIEQFKN